MAEHSVNLTKSDQFQGGFQLFGPSIEALGKNFWTFLQLLLIAIGGTLLGFFALLLTSAANSSDQVEIINIICLVVVFGAILWIHFWTSAATIATQIASSHKRHVTTKAVLDDVKPRFWQWTGLQIVLGLIFIVSLMLLVVPFFFALHRFILAPYYMIERGTGIRESLRQSAHDAKRFSGPVWGLVGVNLLAQIIPLADLLYFCAPALRYREISDASQVKPSTPDPTA